MTKNMIKIVSRPRSLIKSNKNQWHKPSWIGQIFKVIIIFLYDLSQSRQPVAKWYSVQVALVFPDLINTEWKSVGKFDGWEVNNLRYSSVTKSESYKVGLD